jgi:hypothetical protein
MNNHSLRDKSPCLFMEGCVKEAGIVDGCTLQFDCNALHKYCISICTTIM